MFLSGPRKIDCSAMLSIIPEKLKDSEKGQTLLEGAIEKLLLERLLTRKELRLQNMQEKLGKQQKCIEDQKKVIAMINKDLEDMKTTLEKHEQLPGFGAYLSFTDMVAFCSEKLKSIASRFHILISLLIQVKKN